MSIVVIGISHKTAPLEVREKFSLSAAGRPMQYNALKSYPEISEAFILSTCNRVELYGVGRDALHAAGSLKQFLRDEHEMQIGFAESYFYVKEDDEALAHLLRVAGGLDSMVIGEQQIVGQIKKAYEEARAAGFIGSRLHKAIQDALRVGKKVRSLTGISRGVTSIPGAVVELIKKEDGLEDKKALVIGAGKVGCMTVAKLADLPLREITVTNRDMTRAEELKKKRNVRVADIRALSGEIASSDIVIAATAAPGYLLDRDVVGAALKARRTKLLLVDLGVPRNIDEAVRNMKKAELYNIDDLAPIIEETIRNRRLEAEKAEEIIQSEMACLCERSFSV